MTSVKNNKDELDSDKAGILYLLCFYKKFYTYMKHLKDYIKLPVNKSYNKEKSYKYIKENYIGYNNVICQTDDGKILNDFDDFIKENNITNIDEGTYRFFLDSIYDNNYKYIDNPYTYNHYQQELIYGQVVYFSPSFVQCAYNI